MDFLWKCILLVICGLLQMTTQAYGAKNLTEFINAMCPPERPNKCPPEALCHDYEQYCHVGVLEPCFPSNISTNDTAKLEMCLQSVNISLPDATCQSACNSVIAKHYINLRSKQDGELTLGVFINTTCPPERPNKCPPYALCHDYEQYCHDGVLKPCFPSNISTNDTAKLEMCLQSVNISLPDATCQSACNSVIAKDYINLRSKQDGKPNLQDFINTTCPPERPNKCPPDALCHDYEQYCHVGVLEPCFPSDISTNDTAKLEMCLQSVNISLPDATCQSACNSVFAKHYINLRTNQGNAYDYTWVWCLVFLILSIFGNIVLSFLFFYKVMRQRNITVVNNVETGGDNSPRKINSKDNVNYKEENVAEHGTPPTDTPPTGTPPTETPPTDTPPTETPAAAVIESCGNIKQPGFNDSNIIPIVNHIPVEATSSNSENEDSLNQSDQNHGTSNIQDEHTINDSQCGSSIVRRGVRGTSEELAALIPGNEITTSADSHCPAMPKAEGQNGDITINNE